MGRWILAGTLSAIVILSAEGCGSPCTVKRSVRFNRDNALTVLDSIQQTQLTRLPWSHDAVPQHDQPAGNGYRLVLSTPDKAVPMGLFIDSAFTGNDLAFVEGPRIHPGNPGTGVRYYVQLSDASNDSISFSIRDRSGRVLAQPTLQYSLKAYSYLCGFDSP